MTPKRCCEKCGADISDRHRATKQCRSCRFKALYKCDDTPPEKTNSQRYRRMLARELGHRYA